MAMVKTIPSDSDYVKRTSHHISDRSHDLPQLTPEIILDLRIVQKVMSSYEYNRNKDKGGGEMKRKR